MGLSSLAAALNNFLGQSLRRLVGVQRLVSCTLISPSLFFLYFFIYVFYFVMTFCVCATAAWRPVIFGRLCALAVPFVLFIGTFHFDPGFQRRHPGTFPFLLDSFDIVSNKLSSWSWCRNYFPFLRSSCALDIA